MFKLRENIDSFREVFFGVKIRLASSEIFKIQNYKEKKIQKYLDTKQQTDGRFAEHRGEDGLRETCDSITD